MSSKHSYHNRFQWPPLFDNGNTLPSSPISPISDHGCPAQSSRSSTDDDWYGDGSEKMPAFNPANIPLPASPRPTGRVRNSAPKPFSASRAIFPSPTLPKLSRVAVALQSSIESARDTLKNLQVLEDSYDLENLSDTLAEKIKDSVQQALQLFYTVKRLHNNNFEFEAAEDTPLTGTGIQARKGNDNAVGESPLSLFDCTRDGKPVGSFGLNCVTCNKQVMLLCIYETGHSHRAMQTHQSARPSVVLPLQVEATTIPPLASPTNAASNHPIVRLPQAPRQPDQSSTFDLPSIPNFVAPPNEPVYPQLKTDLPKTSGFRGARLSRTFKLRDPTFTSFLAHAHVSSFSTEPTLSSLSEERPWTPRSPSRHSHGTHANTTASYYVHDESDDSKPSRIIFFDSLDIIAAAAGLVLAAAFDDKDHNRGLDDMPNMLLSAALTVLVRLAFHSWINGTLSGFLWE